MAVEIWAPEYLKVAERPGCAAGTGSHCAARDARDAGVQAAQPWTRRAHGLVDGITLRATGVHRTAPPAVSPEELALTLRPQVE